MAANLVQAEAHVARLELDYKRAQTMMGRGAMGREEYDKVVGDYAEAKAAVEVSKAGKRSVEQNLDFTKVQAPISGRISRRFIDPGNLVKADDTILTRIVSLEPIYASFDVDERTTLRLQKLIRDKQITWSQDGKVPVFVGLADEGTTFPRQGFINFADNQVDPDTGTWRLRASFPNKDHALTPGLFVRVRLPIGGAHSALLIPEKAVIPDQGQMFVYVVDAKSTVEYRLVHVGRPHQGLRVVLDGVKPTDKVIVSGLQRVRPGAPVTAKLQGAGVRNQGSGVRG
jgi:RND family efflux transporter MFP subunit